MAAALILLGIVLFLLLAGCAAPVYYCRAPETRDGLTIIVCAPNEVPR
jgi:hypothetical protein